MSGVSDSSHDWQDQLRNVRKVLDDTDVDAIGGYFPIRHRRKTKNSREPDPFEGVVFKRGRRREEVATEEMNNSDDYHEVEIVHVVEQTAVSKSVPHDVRSNEIGEEAFMSRKVDDPFSSGREGDDTRNSNYTLKGKGNGRSKADYDDDHEYPPLTEEEEAELERKYRKGERIKKGILWSIIGAGTASLIGITVVVATSLIGNSKSRIF